MLCAKNTTAVMEEIPIIKPKEIITMKNIENIIESEAVDFIETSASGIGPNMRLEATVGSVVLYVVGVVALYNVFERTVKPAVKTFVIKASKRRAEKLKTEHADEVTIETT